MDFVKNNSPTSDKYQLLLELARQVASIRHSPALLQLIFKQLKPVFHFYDVGLQAYDAHLGLYRDLAAEYPVMSPSPANQELNRQKTFHIPKDDPLTAFVIAELVEAGHPLVFEIKPNAEFDHPPLDTVARHGIQETLTALLTVGGEPLGWFNINRLEKGTFFDVDLDLFQAVADLLALAVINIFAYEASSQFQAQLQSENNYLREEAKLTSGLDHFVGQHPRMQEVFRHIELVAGVNTTVLITGETGTGKELVARAIHHRSDRAHRALIRVNCAAIPESLFESELFGHQKGAFTGALQARIGKFELAQHSTLFLDEISEIPLELQAKLLRVLQEKELERLGSNKAISLDVRIIVASNRSLEHEIAQGRFRADLFFRLNAFPIHLPPLRERLSDIPLLTEQLLHNLNTKLGRNIRKVSAAVEQQLQAYPWPGNVRELEHVLERAAILTRGTILQTVFLPEIPGSTPQMHNSSLAEQEKKAILAALERCHGRIRGPFGAAKILNLKPTTLEARMKKLGIGKLKPAPEHNQYNQP